MAERLGLPFVDLDAEIERAARTDDPRALRGVGRSRRSGSGRRSFSRERSRCRPPSSRPEGAVSPRSVSAGRSQRLGTSVFLDASLETVHGRLAGKTDRPLFQSREQLAALFAARAPFYRMASVRVALSGAETVEEAADRVLTALEDHESLRLKESEAPDALSDPVRHSFQRRGPGRGPVAGPAQALRPGRGAGRLRRLRRQSEPGHRPDPQHPQGENRDPGQPRQGRLWPGVGGPLQPRGPEGRALDDRKADAPQPQVPGGPPARAGDGRRGIRHLPRLPARRGRLHLHRLRRLPEFSGAPGERLLLRAQPHPVRVHSRAARDPGRARQGERVRYPLKKGMRYLINPGSIGQPRDRNAAASYAIYDSTALVVHFDRVPTRWRRRATRSTRRGCRTSSGIGSSSERRKADRRPRTADGPAAHL